MSACPADGGDTGARLVGRGCSRRELLVLTVGSGVAAVTLGNMNSAACASGTDELVIEDLVQGGGAQPKKGDVVEAHYTGWLDGFGQKQFDSSKGRGPLRFTVGVGQVIKGWDEAILTMKEGGKRRIIVPPNLGYGARAAGRVIPPNSTLYFEIELVRVVSS